MSSVGSTDRSYDAVGNPTAIGSGGNAKGFVFDATNRLSQTRMPMAQVVFDLRSRANVTMRRAG